MRPQLRGLLPAAALALAALACNLGQQSGGTVPTAILLTPAQAPTGTPAIDSAAASATPPAVDEAPAINPLTGLIAADPALLQRRPLAIKVSNFPVQGRPHSGLSFADLVFEYDIGVGMTRFLAIFLGTDAPEVGPIRSGRLIDGQLVRMYSGALGMKGADPRVFEALRQRLPNLVFSASTGLCPALCPYTTAYTYGTFGDTAAFSQVLAQRGLDNGPVPLQGMTFEQEPPAGGVAGETVWLVHSYLNQIRWDYDAASGSYLRFQDNADALLAPITDKVTGEQLAFANVVFIFAEHEYLSPTLIEIAFWGQSGQAILFRDGRMYPATWSVPDADRPLQLSTVEGEPLPFKPGSSWFQLVSLESDFDQISPGGWKAQFH